MSEENNKIIPDDTANINETEFNTNSPEIALNDSEIPVNTETPENETIKKISTPPEDISKIKIRTILRQRFKKSGPILRKVIPLIVVGIICFTAGIIAGRGIDRHRNERVFMNRQGMYRQLPKGNFNGGNFNKRQFNGKNGQLPNNKAPQVSPPAATN